jgi:hypothetical protein
MTGNWMQQVRHLLAGWQLARIAAIENRDEDGGIDAGIADRYKLALRELADFLSDFDPIRYNG